MKIKDFLRGELIGLKMEIINSKNKNLIGLKGVIIDETKNTLTFKNNNQIKTVIKNQVELILLDEKNEIKINGELLMGRPEDRLKK